jgi:hypothetical protein
MEKYEASLKKLAAYKETQKQAQASIFLFSTTNGSCTSLATRASQPNRELSQPLRKCGSAPIEAT